jgi:hypothetical protein
LKLADPDSSTTGNSTYPEGFEKEKDMKLEKLLAWWGAASNLYVGMVAALGILLLMVGYAILS